MTTPRPFVVDVPHRTLERYVQRIRDYEWFDEPADANPARWQYGTDGTYLRALCQYWVTDYDWRNAEENLNRFPQFLAEVDGPVGPLDVHFIHERGSNPDNPPLILLHGWPGSYFEFMECIEPLAHPDRFGGDAKDGRDVIVPSLIGYGYSGKPPRPIDPRAQAAYFNGLMTQALGYDTYIAQGGDWGASITAWLGFDFGADKNGACQAIHMNMFGLRAGGDFKNIFGVGIAKLETEDEKIWSREAAKRTDGELGYMVLQSTKPQSLAYAMMDSPVGMAAWIVEKMRVWADRSGEGEDGGAVDGAFTMDQLLTNIMIYLTGRCFHTAAWQYYAIRESGNSALPKGEKIMVPTGFTDFPRELSPLPPRSYLEKAYGNVIHLTKQPKGGHFAALEQPDLFVADVQAFLKAVR